MIKYCFPEGPTEQTETNQTKRNSVLDAGEKPELPGEKPMEASLDWKPNVGLHTAPGPGIKPWLRLSGPQCRGSTAKLSKNV